jgi:preprotein translocase subunit SecG
VQLFIAILNVLLVLCSLFLICLVLIQRGKGGGLAGAFGGVGGSSAFGTKAGDIFTRITIIVAGVWIALNLLLVLLGNQRPASAYGAIPSASSSKKGGHHARGRGGPAPSTKAGPGGGGPIAPAKPSAAPPSPAERPLVFAPRCARHTPGPAPASKTAPAKAP